MAYQIMEYEFTKEELEDLQKLKEELGDDAKFVEFGEGIIPVHPAEFQCCYCQHRDSGDYLTCPHRVPGAFGSFHSPDEIMKWKKRCPDHLTMPGFEKEDAARFKEHFPDEELPPQE